MARAKRPDPKPAKAGGERELRPLGHVTDDDRREFAAAHAEGLHDELPREFCPECETRR